MRLSIATGYKKFLANPTAEPIVLSPGVSVAEFYKGKWVKDVLHGKSGVRFGMVGSDDMVKCNGTYCMIGSLIEDTLKTNPEQAKVRYHSKTDAPVPGDVG